MLKGVLTDTKINMDKDINTYKYGGLYRIIIINERSKLSPNLFFIFAYLNLDKNQETFW